MTEAHVGLDTSTPRLRLGAAALGAAGAQLIGDYLFVLYLVSGLASHVRFGAPPLLIAWVFVAGPVPVGAVIGWLYSRRVLRAGRYLRDRLSRYRMF